MQYLDFTEMPVWQKANFVVEQVYSVCSKLPKSEEYALSSQLKRAALSIAANIAEAFGRNHLKDKVNFYFYARGSVFEVRNHLIVGRNLKFFADDDIVQIDRACRDITEALNKIIKGISSKKDSQPQINLNLPDVKTSSQNYFAHPTAVIDEGCEIGKDVKIWHFCHLVQGCRIGDGSSLGQNVFVGKDVVLGQNVKVQNNVSIYEGVICEDDVFLGPSMVFTNVINPRSAVSRKNEFKKTIVRKGATIGANATIVCGNEIGSYAFIGAGAVITKPVPAYALMVGNPAKQKGWMTERGYALSFDDAGKAICEDGEHYILRNGAVRKVER